MAGGAAAVVGVQVQIVPALHQLAVGRRGVEGRLLNLHTVVERRDARGILGVRIVVFPVAGRLRQLRQTLRVHLRRGDSGHEDRHQQRAAECENAGGFVHHFYLLTDE